MSKEITNRSGPKGVRVDEDFLNRVEEYGKLGHSNRDMARLFNISEAVWYEKKKTFPEITERYLKGKFSVVNVIASKMIEKALAGDMAAMKFVLDRFGWAMEEQSSAGSVELPNGVKFNLVQKTNKTGTED